MVTSMVLSFWHASSTSAAVEVWVAVTTTLMIAEFAMGSIGPRFFSSRRMVAPVVRLLRTTMLNTFSLSYTLGLMKPSPSSNDDGDGGVVPSVNDLFQVWAVLLVTLGDSSRIGRPYGTQDMTLVDLLSSLWSANQLQTQTTRWRLMVPLWLIWSVHTLRVVWNYVSSNRAAEATKGNLKLVSDYMSTSPHTDDDANPTTMQGYRYIVAGEEDQVNEVRLPGFTLEMEMELTTTRPAGGSSTSSSTTTTQTQLLTVERVWNQGSTDDRLLGSAADSDNRFKDVCLCFALYKLQRRRFFDFPIAEAAHPATRRLVSGAILEEGRNGEYERAFRVTTVELSFLHDFFYSKHSVVFAGGFPYVRLLLSVLMAASFSYLFDAVGDIPSSGTAVAGKRPKHWKITHGVLITHYVIAAALCRELIEVVVYLFSQWTILRIVCYYVKLDLQQRRGWLGMVMEKLARVMFWIIRRVTQWDQRIGQYSLLMAMLPPSRNPTLARFYTLCRWPGIRAFVPRKVKLQSETKKCLLKSLKNLVGDIGDIPFPTPSESAWAQQMNSLLSSYFRNAFMDANGSPPPPPIVDAIGELVSETHKILVWHIATSLCHIKLLQEAGQPVVDLCTLPKTPFVGDLAAVWPHYAAAVSLSNYCAYLVTQALAPDNGLVVSSVFEAVCDEVRGALRGCTSVGEIPDRLRSLAPEDGTPPTMIAGMGARLSEELVSSYGGDDRAANHWLWERLAKFWAGFLLDLSASTRASKHKIYLQGCGELTTHLWLLLSHAGFLGKNSHGEQLLDPVDLDNA